MELTKPYAGQTADINWVSQLIQIAHLTSVPYVGLNHIVDIGRRAVKNSLSFRNTSARYDKSMIREE